MKLGDFVYMYFSYVILYNVPCSILACFVEIQLVSALSLYCFKFQFVACIMDSTGAFSSASARDLAEKREELLSRRRERNPVVLLCLHLVSSNDSWTYYYCEMLIYFMYALTRQKRLKQGSLLIFTHL